MSKLKAYDQADLDEVLDNPQWTEEDFTGARPFAEVFPDLAESYRKARGIKTVLSLPLDNEVIDKYRATGPGWPERINEALREAVGLPRKQA